MMSDKNYSIGPLMKAARKFRKLNQADVAQAIGCSQSALSKMEHNLLVPSAPQWFRFSRFTAIPPETLESGVIDRHSPVRFNDNAVSLGFKIPKRYRLHRAEKMREIYPFLKTLEDYSKKLADEFIASTELDPEFFLDFDNLVNFNLVADAMNFFIKHGKHSADDIKKIVINGQTKTYWDHIQNHWPPNQSIQELLNVFSKEQILFQGDFQLKVEKGTERVTLSYYPEYHLKQIGITHTPELLEFLNLYRKFTIEHLIKIVLNQEVEATLVQETISNPLGARFEVKAS